MLSNSLRTSLFLAVYYSHGSAYAQAIDGNTPFRTNGSVLEQHHIEKTVEGLVAALRHTRPEVRMAAAAELAGQGDKSAIPPILAAMDAANDRSERADLAGEAARLGSETALSVLRSLCGRGASMDRVIAAQFMVRVQKEGCLTDIVEVLRKRDDDIAVLMALSMLDYQFAPEPNQDLQGLRDALPPLLREAVTGGHAGLILAKFGDASSLDHLQRAAANVANSGLRESLEEDIKHLKARLSAVAPKQ